MDAKSWLAVGTAGALGLGVMAAGAVSTANAIPLVAGTTNVEVPSITVPGDEVKGTVPLDFTVTSDSIVTPEPSSSASPSPITPATPVTVASAVSPVSPVTPPSPASPVSPASVPSPASPASND